MTDVGIIGVGRLGSALARSVGRAGWTLTAVAGRNAPRARRLAAELGGAHAGLIAASVTDVLARAELVLLAVPDAVVASLCAALPWKAHHAVAHTAGALGLSALASARAQGARTGAFHPLQVFPEGAGPAQFEGITIGIEADAGLDAPLEALCRALGAQPLSLAGVNRASYHAAAVLASNYVVALHAAAAEAFELAGLPAQAARRALAPLTLGALRNLENDSLAHALTGPVARGDVATVQSHLAVLRARPELATLYRTLGRQLLRLPLQLPADARTALDALFRADVEP